MSQINTIYSRPELKSVENMPGTTSELYNLALELNKVITDSLNQVFSTLPDNNQKTVKNLLFYQKIEKTKLIELLHYELNNCYQAFCQQNKEFINVYKGKEELAEGSNLLNKSLDTFTERIKNFQHICTVNRKVDEVDFLILYLGLRDYCSNMFQQLSANYQADKLSRCCKELVGLLDRVSDEIGLAYTAQQ